MVINGWAAFWLCILGIVVVNAFLQAYEAHILGKIFTMLVENLQCNNLTKEEYDDLMDTLNNIYSKNKD